MLISQSTAIFAGFVRPGLFTHQCLCILPDFGNFQPGCAGEKLGKSRARRREGIHSISLGMLQRAMAHHRSLFTPGLPP